MAENINKFFNKTDVFYGRIDNLDIEGTLFLPAEAVSLQKPAVLFIHGGGWRNGTRQRFFQWAEKMTISGMAAFCISYRLSHEGIYPAAIQDAKCAVRFLRANAAKYGLNPDRIGAVGTSAGAHLAACLATTGNKKIKTWEDKGGFADYASHINAAVLLNGEFDVPGWWKYGQYNDFMLDFIGKSYDEAPGLYAEASPITHIDSQTCPCLLIHGEEDKIAPICQSVDFYRQILLKGGNADLIRVPEAGHAWFYNEPYNSQCINYTSNYMIKHLLGDTHITEH